jgi:hypothetical protein
VPILEADIVKRYSVAAAAGNTTVGTAATSLGDQVSQTPIPDDQFSNLFPDVTGDEASGGVVKYRCVFVHNAHATLTLQNGEVSIQSQIALGGTIAIAVDNIAASALGAATPQAAVIANENVAPVGTTAFGNGPIVIGALGPGQVRAVWIRLTVPAGATPPAPDGTDDFVLLIDGDSLP